MATYTCEFGLKTLVGQGGFAVPGETAGDTLSGTGSTDWKVTTGGPGGLVVICPAGAGADGTAKVFSKGDGQTYTLTFVGTGHTIDITMRARKAHITTPTTDTTASTQWRFQMQLTYSSASQPQPGDTVIWRTGSVYNPTVSGTGTQSSWTFPSSGMGGFGQITSAGTGYPSTLTTFKNVDAVTLTGTGAGAKLLITTSGGQVVNIHVNWTGSGYQAGDTITANFSTGTGLVFTVGAHWFDPVIVTSEATGFANVPAVYQCPVGVNGFPKFHDWDVGGSAVISNKMEASGVANVRLPIRFQFMSFARYSGTTGTQPTAFFRYRTRNGGGVSFYNCYFANADSIPSAGSLPAGAMIHQATAYQNYFYRTGNWMQDGDPTDQTFGNSLLQSNTGVGGVGNGIIWTWLFVEMIDNLCANWGIAYTHPDFIQHAGIKAIAPGKSPNYIDGQTLYVGDVIVRENINLRNVGRPKAAIPDDGCGAAQGMFARGNTANLAYIKGLVVENNIGVSVFVNETTAYQFIDPVVRFNTFITPADAPNLGGFDLGNGARTFIRSGTGGLVDLNIYNEYQWVPVSEPPQTGYTFDPARNLTITYDDDPVATVSVYNETFQSYVWTGGESREEVRANLSPILGGNARVPSGSPPTEFYMGALFPDGSFNDGTSFDTTPATSLSAFPSATEVNQLDSVTLLVQSDAAATLAITVTPHLSGVTGSFSPSTSDIGTGTSTTQFSFTPTSTGTATVTFTNNRSLTNPAPILITVDSGPPAPTSYTQEASPNPAGLTSTITLTFTLDSAAQSDVTITSACAGGVYPNGDTVVIVSGTTTGQIIFTPSNLGTLTFSATNDSGLTDPANIQVVVTSCTVGQLLALGIRP